MRNHPHLIEISVWPWLDRLSRAGARRVTLADVPGEHWDRIAKDGFDCVFMMGVWRRSAIGREIARAEPGLVAEYHRALPGWTDADVVGSPYCIQAYEPDERMGGWDGLDLARRELQKRGVSLILDFVPNHTAFDHPWITEHPDRYVIGTEEDYRRTPADFRAIEIDRHTVHVACARDPFFPPWTDVAQLNYFNLETRDAVQAALRSIAAHCDGVRCDMAMLVLNDVFEGTWRRLLRDRWPVPAAEFWETVTCAVPRLIYLAEVYWNLEGRMLDQGFSFAYDKRLLDALHSGQTASRVRELLGAENPPPSRLSRFIENHDEPRSAATLGEQLPAAASVAASLPGMRFFFDGQREGRRIRTPVQLGRWADEPVNPATRELYDRILAFAKQPVLHDGAWRILAVSPSDDDSWENIVAYRWRLDDSLAVATVNLGASASQAHVAVAEDLPAGHAFDFEDALTGHSYRWSRESLSDRGLWVRLEPGRAHLFTVRKAGH